MADIAASNVTHTFNPRDKIFLGKRGYSARGTLAFGDGALTVPSAGIPLTKGKMGLPRRVSKLIVIESNNSGYRFEYDVSAEKLFVQTYDVAAASNAKVANAFTGAIAATTLEVEVEGY